MSEKPSNTNSSKVLNTSQGLFKETGHFNIIYNEVYIIRKMQKKGLNAF